MYTIRTIKVTNATNTTEKIIIFNLKMFIGRGIKQKKTVPTSSLIIVLQNKLPNKNHKVKIIKYYKKNDIVDIGKYLKSKCKKHRAKRINR